MWHIDNDDLFAKTYCAVSPSTVWGSEVQMCTCCKSILSEKLIDRSVTVEIASLVASTENCRVCNLLIRVFLDGVSDDGSIKLFRTKMGLNTGSGGKRLVRIGAHTSKFAENLHGMVERICGLNLGRRIQPDKEFSTTRSPCLA